MIIDKDILRQTEIRDINYIKGFLRDKRLLKISVDMINMGVGLSYPILKRLRDSDTDYHSTTIRKISYFINNYNK